MHSLRRLLTLFIVAIGLASPLAANARTAGCYGKMWNPLTALDFNLMGPIKVFGTRLMKGPSALGDPPEHKINPICACTDAGLQSGVGIGLTFWLPSYINDVSRQAGCLGFLGGMNILPGFISLSSGQEYNTHHDSTDSNTGMQIHWAYADVTAIIGKSFLERCNASSGSLEIGYLTEPDFVFQEDVYAALLSPQVALLAENAFLSQMACGYESMANTLGDWQDWGVCAWKGGRLPLSGNTVAKDSAQVTNMDITIKYLTRASLLGLNKKTMGEDAVCKPQYSAFYDPFQHRFQWSYPAKVSTRFNIDVMRWGMFIKDMGESNLVTIADQAVQIGGADATSSSTSPDIIGQASAIVKKLPKPLNYPTREAGYMQVWEARQCCLIMLTLENAIQMIIEYAASMGSATIQQLYQIYNTANTIYSVIQDPIGAALGVIGKGIASGLTSLGKGVADGLSKSLSSVTS